MKKKIFINIVSLIIFACISHAQWKLETPFHSLVINGIDYILKQEYNRADSLFRYIANHFPNHPAGFLYQAAAMQAYSIDFDVPVERRRFDSLLELGKKTAEKLDSPWREYFLGTADGYEAYERVERGDWFGGVKKGMSSASKFEEVVEKDSSFYDAYVGIGTYYYWRSRKTAFIRWLPFVSDDRQPGIQMLITASERSEYNRFAAMSALVSIYLDTEDYKQVEDWSLRGLKYYPENRIFLWGFATALDRQKRFIDAAKAYTTLLENLLHINSPHPYNEIVCRLNLVKTKLAVEDTSTIEHHLKQLLSYEKNSFPSNMQSRAKAKFEEAHILLSTLEKRGIISK